MVVSTRRLLVVAMCLAALGLSGLVFAQPPPSDRPYLAKDANEAIKFLGEWTRVPSGQEFFQGATYVGSQACGGSGCHDQQVSEWKKTWHSKILRDPSETDDGKPIVIGDFNSATVSFANVRAVAKGTPDSELGKAQNIPAGVQVKTETKDGKYYFVVVDPKDASKNQRYEVVKVVGGKWQQTYHVHPLDKDGKPIGFYFPAPIRWSVTSGRKGDMPGRWEIVNFQPESWVWSDPTGAVTPRAQDELPLARFGEPKCMGCHTTGFSIEKPSGSPHWEMKAQGTGELAIGCERCHGPGSKHVDAAKQKAAAGQKLDPKQSFIVHGLKDLSLDQQNQVCGQCHARVGNKDQRDLAFQNKLFVDGAPVADDRGFLPGDSNIVERSWFWSHSDPTGPGQGLETFWQDGRGKKSRTQWQDHVSSAHASKGGASCLTCHSFHGDAVVKDPQQQSKLRQPPKELCESCHNQAGTTKQPNREIYAGTNSSASSQHADQDVQCVDCHMGAVGQRMTKTVPQSTDNPKNGGGEAGYDVSFHGTTMALPPSSNPPSDLDMRGNCEVCHTDQRKMNTGTTAKPKTPAQLREYVNKIQDSTKVAVTQIQGRAKTNKNTDGKTAVQLSNAQSNLNMILIDGSMGVHNSRVAPNGKVSPQGGIADCLRLANLWVELACRQTGAQCTGVPYNKITGPITEPNPAVCLAN
jgi:hypothetical protein